MIKKPGSIALVILAVVFAAPVAGQAAYGVSVKPVFGAVGTAFENGRVIHAGGCNYSNNSGCKAGQKARGYYEKGKKKASQAKKAVKNFGNKTKKTYKNFKQGWKKNK